MTDINVSSTTQKIYVDPASSSISIVNAGPQGPQGPPGASVVQQDQQEELATLIEELSLIIGMTNANINARRARVIKDLARACRTIARIISDRDEVD